MFLRLYNKCIHLRIIFQLRWHHTGVMTSQIGSRSTTGNCNVCSIAWSNYQQQSPALHAKATSSILTCVYWKEKWGHHYGDVIVTAMASQITSLTIVYATVYSGEDQRKHQSSASLAFVRGINRWPVNSPHKGPVTRKMFPFDDVIRIRKYL